jgi:membrane associated rhomboid family serine protease
MQDGQQIYLPKLTIVNKTLIIFSSVLFILNFILVKTAGMNLINILGLSASGISHGYVHSLITYPFVSNSIFEVILNCLMLWLMGSEFEANWGVKRYVSFIGTTVIGGAVLFLLVSSIFFQGTEIYAFPISGLSGIVASMCMAYAVIYPDRIFSFLMLIPVKAKYFCMILVVITLYQGVASPSGVGAWGQLGAIFSAYLFMVIISHRNMKSLSEKLGKMTQIRSVKKSRAKLSIVKDDSEKPPKYWH